MSTPTDAVEQARPTECRRCRVYCDWVVEPTACVERECVNLYAVEASDGHRYVGCMMRIFGPEIDADQLERAHARRQAFGGLRCLREPLPICRAGVERAYPQRTTPARLPEPASSASRPRPTRSGSWRASRCSAAGRRTPACMV